MNKSRLPFFLFSLALFTLSCNKADTDQGSPLLPSVNSVFLSTDKACYKPGEVVKFELDRELPNSAMIRYRHLNTIVDETLYSGKNWSWNPPASDFTGFMADVYEMKDGVEKVYGSIAVDVSSDWCRFPRYGFLSEYQAMTPSAIDYVVENLARYHINGLQFYDWQFDHHKPLAGTVENPAEVWKDIANRDNCLSTVQGYIDAAHRCNMKAMFYNLAYGALSNASGDGVLDQWYLFTDLFHASKDFHALPTPMFKSNIYLTDPSNREWQQYLAQQNRDVYEVFDFDGFHIDQLGNRNRTLYNYGGYPVNLPQVFKDFIQAMKMDMPDKELVMNAVNQYGQAEIASSAVSFLYSEVWAPNDGFDDLAGIITANNALSNNAKNTVLAAYMNYDLANSSGFFNPADVLLANSVIFAFGGSHLELGEHMLAKEYFPNNNLQVSGQLRSALITYYDFLVAYQNLLRDGGEINQPEVNSDNSQVNIGSWPPEAGKIAVVGRLIESAQIINLINFNNVSSMLWRDTKGDQLEPVEVKNLYLKFKTSRQVEQVWIASPDLNFGLPQSVNFSSLPDGVEIDVPYLKYWDMIVVEYQ